MNGTSTNNSVQSVERALNILLIIADETLPVSIARIVECSGLNRTTVWRLLVTLEDCGFVEKDPISKGYLLGYNASRLCSDIMDNYAPLIRLAKPYMDKLLDEINEDILLTVPRFGGMLTIYQLHSDNAVLIRDYSMMLSQFHSSSNGKIYLSFLEPEELRIYPGGEWGGRKWVLDSHSLPGKALCFSECIRSVFSVYGGKDAAVCASCAEDL